jgi:hypothetical protein
MVRYRDELRRHHGMGKGPAMLRAAREVLREPPFLRVDLRVFDDVTSVRTPFVFVGNNRYEMDLFALGGRAALDRGELSLYVARNVSDGGSPACAAGAPGDASARTRSSSPGGAARGGGGRRAGPSGWPWTARSSARSRRCATAAGREPCASWPLRRHNREDDRPLSDLHFGREDARVVEAVLEDVAAGRPDLIVVSGDLTQRARRRQFEAARAFLDRLPAPVLVVPGNHDVPLFDLARRFLRPPGALPRHRHRPTSTRSSTTTSWRSWA